MFIKSFTVGPVATNCYLVADETTVAQCHTAVILEMATGVDKDMAPDSDIPAEVGVERRKHLERFIHRLTEQARH